MVGLSSGPIPGWHSDDIKRRVYPGPGTLFSIVFYRTRADFTHTSGGENEGHRLSSERFVIAVFIVAGGARRS